jgi:tRNA-dihydrouridine synthase
VCDPYLGAMVINQNLVDRSRLTVFVFFFVFGFVARLGDVQFAANDPDVLLQAAKLVEKHCDAVDINL